MKYKIVISPSLEEQVVIYAKSHSPTVERIVSLLEGETRRILGYSSDEAIMLSPEEIECVTVIDGKATAITAAGRFTLRERLYFLEELLGDSFIRINKSTLANVNCIHSFNASFGGSLMIKFKCGYRDYVSRRQHKAVKEKLI